jgi:deoxyribodipyrimidine photolyase-like uncharacterized protein
VGEFCSLVLVLGDQLDLESAAFDGFEPQLDAVWIAGHAPLASVESFVRQILGWREWVRGIYWTQMPGYLERDTLGADEDLPHWYWTEATDMACLRVDHM